MAAERSCCRRINGGRGPSGDKSPTSGDETTGSSAQKKRSQRSMLRQIQHQKVDYSTMMLQSPVNIKNKMFLTTHISTHTLTHIDPLDFIMLIPK